MSQQEVKQCTKDGCIGQIYFSEADHATEGKWRPLDSLTNQPHKHYYKEADAPKKGQAFAQTTTIQSKISAATCDEKLEFAKQCLDKFLEALKGKRIDPASQNCSAVFNTGLIQR